MQPLGQDMIPALMQDMLDAIPEGILFCDRDLTIRIINKYYASLLGSSPRALYGKNLQESNPKTQAADVMRKGTPDLWDMCAFPNFGEVRRYIVNRIPVLDKNGSIIGMLSHVLFKDPSELKQLYDRVEKLSNEVNFYKNSIKSILKKNYDIASIIGNSPYILKVKRSIRDYADKNYPVLVCGKTGTGKELVARALHSESSHADGPFICINCAAIPKELFESELFGYAPGAFSGAQKDGKAGQIELADNGTLFLDEIGDLPLHVQVKLLRVLENKRIMRVGSTEEQVVQFRLVTATNRNLEDMVRKGTFREDLYYRINTLRITLPSLAKRTEDIVPIAHSILARLGHGSMRFTERAVRVLEANPWPGNIRQLYNTLVHASIHSAGNIIDVDGLPDEVVGQSERSDRTQGLPESMTLAAYMDFCEAGFLRRMLGKSRGNMTALAKSLGISRVTLYSKLKKHNILSEDMFKKCKLDHTANV